MPTIRGIHYASLEPIAVVVEAGVIQSVQDLDASGEPPQASTDLPWLVPGLCDLQINGAQGYEFGSPDLTGDQVLEMCDAIAMTGVSRFLPTLTTQDHGWLAQSLSTMTSVIEETPGLEEQVIGFHLEGPYICPEDGPRGAHPKEHCREPNWDEFQQLQQHAQGRIRILTLSPDYEGSDKFIRKVVDAGVCVALGHTAASTDQIKAAVDAGASLSTHLGNGAHAMIQRHPNYIWDQLVEDRLWATLIADGQHLPDNVIRAFARCKSLERLILISDITGLAGSQPGRHESHTLGAIEVLSDGRLVRAGQSDYLAGASRPLFFGINKMMEVLHISLAQAVGLATHHPANFLGISRQDIQAGDPANFLEVVPHNQSSCPCRVQNVWWRGKPHPPSRLLEQ